jgi:phosphoribosylformylglycinamidine (FGAM) synthase PurS component
MKAVIHVDLTITQAEEAKKILEDACRKLHAAGLIKAYRFEIETPEGPVTEKCILSAGKVIA